MHINIIYDIIYNNILHINCIMCCILIHYVLESTDDGESQDSDTRCTAEGVVASSHTGHSQAKSR